MRLVSQAFLRCRFWRIFVLVSGWLCVTGGPVHAAVRLPRIFSDHMVLQQQMDVPIWGWADAGEQVAVQFADQSVQTQADERGRWRVHLQPLVATMKPQSLIVQGENRVEMQDVLVGEVWLCSGQSNMEFQLSRALRADQALADADTPTIRLLKVPHRTKMGEQDDAPLQWQLCSSQNAAEFSAVGYFFGQQLCETLGIPIGLIDSTWGGTPGEAWTPRQTLEDHPETRGIFDRIAPSRAASEADFKQWREAVKQWKAQSFESNPSTYGRPWPRPRPPKPYQPGNKQQPTGLYNAMIAPLSPFAMRGAIWYQGESNIYRAWQYRTLLPAMIEAWRRDWGQKHFYFGIVQLANFRQPFDQPIDDHWAELREAQLHTVRTVADTGLAVTIDIGDASDVHPRNKFEVGRRLALWALHDVYGQNDLVYSGPIYRDVTFREDEAVIDFDHVGSGLTTSDGKPPAGFAIASGTGSFVWAHARIENDRVIVWHESVPNPAAVRYAWQINPADANLINEEGLPASPFRTDDWRMMTRPTASQ